MEVQRRAQAAGNARRTTGWQNMANEGVRTELL